MFPDWPAVSAGRPRGGNGKVGADVEYYDVARIFCAWVSAAVQKCD